MSATVAPPRGGPNGHQVDVAAPARVETVAGRHWWKCRNCGKTLGEFVGCRLIVVVRGYEVKMPAIAGLALACQRCGVENVLD